LIRQQIESKGLQRGQGFFSSLLNNKFNFIIMALVGVWPHI